MCDWEEFLFQCNHSTLRLKSYCHFARNDPYHQCFGVKVLRNSWRQCVPCDDCAPVWRAAQMQGQQHNYQDGQPMSGQGSQQSGS